ncbi:MAG: winged helix-turn-helix transcriptional regulator [Candidatus Marsarchaeota archaeon]|nr:winged helix-turn-helix transcriptional regulator [Candidatus Marsarchaeota archaeon]
MSTKELENKIKIVAKKDAIDILYSLKDSSKSFTQISGNMDAKSKRLKELIKHSLVKTLVMDGKRKRVGYSITEKGIMILSDVENLGKHLD